MLTLTQPSLPYLLNELFGSLVAFSRALCACCACCCCWAVDTEEEGVGPGISPPEKAENEDEDEDEEEEEEDEEGLKPRSGTGMVSLVESRRLYTPPVAPP